MHNVHDVWLLTFEATEGRAKVTKVNESTNLLFYASFASKQATTCLYTVTCTSLRIIYDLWPFEDIQGDFKVILHIINFETSHYMY